jgi:hypothetical protein
MISWSWLRRLFLILLDIYRWSSSLPTGHCTTVAVESAQLHNVRSSQHRHAPVNTSTYADSFFTFCFPTLLEFIVCRSSRTLHRPQTWSPPHLASCCLPVISVPDTFQLSPNNFQLWNTSCSCLVSLSPVSWGIFSPAVLYCNRCVDSSATAHVHGGCSCLQPSDLSLNCNRI